MATHVVTLREVEVVEHVVGRGIADVPPVEIERCEHDAHPELNSGLVPRRFCVELTMTFQSTARRVSRSSRHVHLNLGSNAS